MPASRRVRILGFAGLALAAVAGLVFAALPRVAELAILAALRARGVAEARLQVREIGLRGAALERIAIGRAPALTVDELSLTWSPRGLWCGRVDAARAQGVRARGEWLGTGALRFAELEPLLRGGGAGELPRELSLSGARVEIAWPKGELAAVGDLTAATDGARVVRLRAALSIRGAGLRGRLAATWQASGEASAQAVLRAPGRFASPLGVLEDAELTVDVAASTSEPEGAAGEAPWRERLRGAANARLVARALHREGMSSLRDLELRASADRRADPGWRVAASLAGARGDAIARVSADTGVPELPADVYGFFPLTARVNAQLASGTGALPRAELAGELRVSWRGARLHVEAVSPLPLRLEPDGRGGPLTAPFATTLSDLWLEVGHSGRPLLARATLTPASVELANAGVLVRGRTPRALLEVADSPNGPTLRFTARGGQLDFPRPEVRASRLGVAGSFAPTREGSLDALEVGQLLLEDRANPPRFSRLSLRSQLSGLGSRVSASGSLDDGGGPDLIPFALRERGIPGERFSGLDVEIGPTHFDGRNRDLVRLALPLAAAFDSVTGTVAWRGSVDLPRRGGPHWAGSLSLEQGAFAIDALRVDGLAGALGVTSLDPLELAPSAITFARADVGPGLAQGDVRVSLERDLLRLSDLSARTLDGRVTGDVLISLGSAPGEARLRFEAVSIEKLARFLGLESLQADGAIHGDLSATFDARGLAIRSGFLQAERPGALRYRPAAPPAALQSAGPEAGVLLAALSDFRFERMRLDLEPGEAGLVARLATDGHNPSLKAGRPIELRARIEVPLPELTALSAAWKRLLRALARSH